MPPALYHFTCAHRAPVIQRCGELRPNRHPLLGASLVWLTDLPEPDRWGLGLTSNWLSCDRTAVRVCLLPVESGVVPWRSWALWYQVPAALLETLNDGARSDRWWVSEQPLRISALTAATYATAHDRRDT